MQPDVAAGGRAKAALRAQAVAREAAKEQEERQRALEAQDRVKRENEARERQRFLEAQERNRREQEARERQRLLETQERARREQEARIAAARTTQRVILGSIVTFASGLDIRGFTTGFESCIVHIRGLPMNASEREIYMLFTQQGIPEASLYLMFNKVHPNGTREVKMAMNAEAGHALSVGLDELEFRDRHLSFEVGTYNIPGAMGASQGKDPNTLLVSWPMASARYIVTYNSLETAERMAQELNGSVRLGRRLKVERDKTFPGRKVPVLPNSIKIDNLPPSVVSNDVHSLAGSETRSMHVLPTRGAPTSILPEQVVTRWIALAGGPGASSVAKADTDADRLKGMMRVRAGFQSWDDAKRVHDYIETRKPLGMVPCYLDLPQPLSYVINIPQEQFDVQRVEWLQLQNSVAETKGCNFTYFAVQGRPIMRFRVSGSDQKAVGSLKLRVETLAKGEKIVGWHAQFGQQNSKNAIAFVSRVHTETGALMRADWRQRHIKLFGGTEAIARAQGMVADELARLTKLEFTTHVPQNAVRFLLAEGLPQLREILGGDDSLVHFNPATRVLTTSGGDEARHIVSRIIDEAVCARTALPTAHQGTLCPICFDEVTAPVRLGCDHTYCSTCLRHFLTSAGESDKFPLVCMGDEAQCNVPIAIPVIERFLSVHQFDRLLESTFKTYISQRPVELKYCWTPDCEQIYRAMPQGGLRPSSIQCPACLSVVCPQCHVDGHEGRTCKEQRVYSNPAEQDRLVDEWIASQEGRVRRCPQCRVPIEKTEGCNHMTCQ